MSVRSKKRKDGSTAWYYDIMVEGQRYRKFGGATRTQALRAQEKARTQILNGEYGLETGVSKTKIEEFARTYLDRRQHLKSRRRDNLSVRTLLRFFKGKQLKAIDAAVIEDYIAWRRSEGVSNATINRELACLKRMYNLAIRWKEVRHNPVTSIDMLKEPPGRTRFLYEDEANRLIQAANPYFRPVIITALNTGMRLGEILSLSWQSVHLESVVSPYIEVSVSKNNRKRHIPLTGTMTALFRGLKAQRRHSRYVFVSSNGEPYKCIKKVWHTALRRAGIEDFRFHDLRHTFASHFIMRGGDLLSLKEILGHTTLKMVERYAHLAAAHKIKQMNHLDGLFNDCQLYVNSDKSSTI